MDDNNIKYTDRGEFVARVSYAGDNLKSIPVNVFFNEDGDGIVQLCCYEIAGFKGDKIANGLIACNALNQKYRWAKFYLDSDNDVRAELDACISRGTTGEECANLVRRVVSIVDKSYPTIMKALGIKIDYIFLAVCLLTDGLFADISTKKHLYIGCNLISFMLK